MLQNVVVGILKRDGKLLVAERPEGKPYSGYWEFPGGKIEPGETAEQAIKRELHEELGIDVVESAFSFSHTHDYPDKTVFLEIWEIKTFIGEPHSKENQTIRWVSWKDMQHLRILEGNAKILGKIKTMIAIV